MEDKNPIGSKESIRCFVKNQERWARTWLVLIAFNMSEAIYCALMLGLEGFTWWRALFVILFAVFAGVYVVLYGITRERIVFGKILYANWISVKIDEDGNTVSTVHMEEAENQED